MFWIQDIFYISIFKDLYGNLIHNNSYSESIMLLRMQTGKHLSGLGKIEPRQKLNFVFCIQIHREIPQFSVYLMYNILYLLISTLQVFSCLRWRDRFRLVSENVGLEHGDLALLTLHWNWVAKHSVKQISEIFLGNELHRLVLEQCF